MREAKRLRRRSPKGTNARCVTSLPSWRSWATSTSAVRCSPRLRSSRCSIAEKSPDRSARRRAGRPPPGAGSSNHRLPRWRAAHAATCIWTFVLIFCSVGGDFVVEAATPRAGVGPDFLFRGGCPFFIFYGVSLLRLSSDERLVLSRNRQSTYTDVLGTAPSDLQVASSFASTCSCVMKNASSFPRTQEIFPQPPRPTAMLAVIIKNNRM